MVLGVFFIIIALAFTPINGSRVDVNVTDTKEKETVANTENPFEKSDTYKWDLEKTNDKDWAYPLPGAHVISPYGGAPPPFRSRYKNQAQR